MLSLVPGRLGQDGKQASSLGANPHSFSHVRVHLHGGAVDDTDSWHRASGSGLAGLIVIQHCCQKLSAVEGWPGLAFAVRARSPGQLSSGVPVAVNPHPTLHQYYLGGQGPMSPAKWRNWAVATITDREWLAGLKNLETLNLYNTGITEAAVKEVAGLKSLHTLNLGHTRVTDRALEGAGRTEKLANTEPYRHRRDRRRS